MVTHFWGLFKSGCTIGLCCIAARKAGCQIQYLFASQANPSANINGSSEEKLAALYGLLAETLWECD